ncbi:MAG: hypothetical protein ACPLPR_05005 [Bacillota bacterium]
MQTTPVKAEALLDSQKELLELEIEETEGKLDRTRKKLDLAMKKPAQAEKKDDAADVIQKLRLAIKGRKGRVGFLERKLAELVVHRENGIVPKVVFGSRRLWERVCEGRPSGRSGGQLARTAFTPRGTRPRAATRT